MILIRSTGIRVVLGIVVSLPAAVSAFETSIVRDLQTCRRILDREIGLYVAATLRDPDLANAELTRGMQALESPRQVYKAVQRLEAMLNGTPPSDEILECRRRVLAIAASFFSDDWSSVRFLLERRRAELSLKLEAWNDVLEDSQRAQASLDRSSDDQLAVMKQSRDRAEARIRELRTEAYLALGLVDLAAATFRREGMDAADGTLRTAPDRWRNFVVHRANLRLAQQRYDELIDEVRSALGEGSWSASDRALLDARIAMALADMPGRRPEAVPILEHVIASSETSPEERIDAKLRLTHLRVRLGQWEAATDALASSFEENLGVVDRAWALALRSRIARRRGTPETARFDELLEAHRGIVERWLRYPRRPGGYGYLHYERRRFVIEEIIATSLERESGPEPAFRIFCETQGLGTLARDLGRTSATLEEVRARLLGETDGLLAYFAGTDDSFLFAVDRGDLEVFELPSRDELIERQAELFAAVARPPRSPDDDAWRSIAREVGRRFVPKALAAKVAGWSTILITGHDVLGYIPFECLIIGDDRELGLDHPIVYLPSIPVGLALADRRRTRGAPSLQGLLVAAPTLSREIAEGYRLAPFDPDRRWDRELTGLEGTRVEARIGERATLLALDAASRYRWL
ncbi:MAG: hypothetical protein KDC38_19980, partial [Planctomycetes bacterium]|nr:hypothetical protein [Planctomycetota bacterium]